MVLVAAAIRCRSRSLVPIIPAVSVGGGGVALAIAHRLSLSDPVPPPTFVSALI